MEKGNDKTLFGLACSPGRVQGTVRVLKTIHDSQALKQGEIMVVPYTDPGWTPLFGLTAGVITETGGLLSHAALIAREYSIPAVLNIPDATEKLKTGMQIELDGTSGRILILSDV
jgi:pyruvate,water dikinase